MIPSLVQEALVCARALLRKPPVRAGSALFVVGGAALTCFPLFETPGFELAAALTLGMSLLGGGIGVAAARLARAAVTGTEVSGRCARPLLSLVSAAAVCAVALACPFLFAVGGALTTTRCSPWVGAGFYLLLPFPTALLSCALGLLAGFATRRARAAWGLYLALLFGSLAASCLPVWAGPQVFVLNHLAGYLPGPIYDEALRVDARIVAYRVLTLLWTGLSVTATVAFLDPREATLRPVRPSRGMAFALFALSAAIAAMSAFSFPFGLETTREDLDRVLSGRSETAHFVLHFPRVKPREDLARLERDLEFKYEQVTRFLGAESGKKIHAYFHESAEAKRRLVGASHTNFAKPWRNELHVLDVPAHHGVVRHEMAHVIAGEFGSPLLRVSARGLLLVNAGIVEGLATAADDRADDLTLHEWSAAMRRLELAPDVRQIVGPSGFYAEAQWRAYTLAGSFFRFLAERRGSAGLRALYPAGDFASAYGESLDALAAEWEAMLDALPIDERAMHAAEVRFERPGIFGRPCAHEVALLKEEALALARADPERALRLHERCAEIEPGNALHRRDQATILLRGGDRQGARRLFEGILSREGVSAGQRAQTLMDLGDLAWEEGDLTLSRARFEEVLALHRDRGTDRAAAVRLEAQSDAAAGPVIRRYFTRGADLPEIVALKDLAVANPRNAVARYLIGRQLFQRGDHDGASRHLEDARAIGFADEELARENLRVLAQAHYFRGACGAVREVLGSFVSGAVSEADLAFREDWEARCVFEEREYGGPIVP